MINPDKNTRGVPAGASPSVGVENHRPVVLVVDDDRHLAQAIADSLEAKGIDTLIAFDGNAGLAVAITQEPALIVLDSRMPYRSGYLVLEHLATETDLLIPTILISENEGGRHRSYAQMLGAIEFVEKPIDTLKLASRVAEMLAVPAPTD